MLQSQHVNPTAVIIEAVYVVIEMVVIYLHCDAAIVNDTFLSY